MSLGVKSGFMVAEKDFATLYLFDFRHVPLEDPIHSEGLFRLHKGYPNELIDSDIRQHLGYHALDHFMLHHVPDSCRLLKRGVSTEIIILLYSLLLPEKVVRCV